MHNNYLETLGLQPGATKTDIKGAFRKLSKKYHPDVNKSEDAQGKFIAIHEAYKFLTGVGPKPNNESVRYDYDPGTAAYQDWRRKAREYAWKKAKEAKVHQELQMFLLLRYFNYFAALIFLFNVLITIDYFLPKKVYHEKITSIDVPDFQKNGLKYYHQKQYLQYQDVKFEHFNMRFDFNETYFFRNVDKGKVVSTQLFKTPLFAVFNSNGESVTVDQIYSIYRIFGYLIPIAFFILFLYSIVIKNPDHRITLALFLLALFIIQSYLFLKY